MPTDISPEGLMAVYEALGWTLEGSVAVKLSNPQLILYSTALGGVALTVRIVSCFLCGIAAGLLIRGFCKGKPFFDFTGFDGFSLVLYFLLSFKDMYRQIPLRLSLEKAMKVLAC